MPTKRLTCFLCSWYGTETDARWFCIAPNGRPYPICEYHALEGGVGWLDKFHVTPRSIYNYQNGLPLFERTET